eukprot:COSAG02_NODE_42507_length_384_cov_0.540351_1_plen_40_part_10
MKTEVLGMTYSHTTTSIKQIYSRRLWSTTSLPLPTPQSPP